LPDYLPDYCPINQVTAETCKLQSVANGCGAGVGQDPLLSDDDALRRIQAWPESPQRVRARDIKNILREHMKLGASLSRQLLDRAAGAAWS
jgi:hypothetical protein